jgi:hypothetical protein
MYKKSTAENPPKTAYKNKYFRCKKRNKVIMG